MSRQRVTFYYDDEYDLGIHQLLVNVPNKRKGEAIRTALNRALGGVPLAPQVQHIQPVQQAKQNVNVLHFEPEN